MNLSRIISSIASALLGSIIFTIFNTMTRNVETTLYYSATSLFITGFAILFFLFLFIATPLSFFLEKKFKNYSFLTKTLLYFATWTSLGALFLLFNPSNSMEGILKFLLISGCSGVVFFLFTQLTDFISVSIRKVKK